MDFKYSRNGRGFETITFTDLYDAPCSIQKSSLATDDAIWIGIDDPKPQIMAIHAKKLGIQTKETCGWIPYPIPEEVLIRDRMHLTQGQVKDMLPILQYFAEHGELPTSELELAETNEQEL